MAIDVGVGVIDTLVTFPAAKDTAGRYEFVQGSMGQHGGDSSKSPVEYLFRNAVTLPEGREPIEYTLSEMDRFGIERGVVDLALDPVAPAALTQHPERFIGTIAVDPNQGMEAVRAIERAKRDFGIRGVDLLPAFQNPQVPIDDRRMYPIYAKCIELGLTVFVTVGVPGPRVPMAPQRVELLDEVCWFFPELKIVMRHGGEPWVDLAVKLMIKWENLYYSTSAFAPRYYPEAIVKYANTRGADKILFGAYFGVALPWDRVFSELEQVPLRDEVWPKFLRGNSMRVLGLDATAPSVPSSVGA